MTDKAEMIAEIARVIHFDMGCTTTAAHMTARRIAALPAVSSASDDAALAQMTLAHNAREAALKEAVQVAAEWLTIYAKAKPEFIDAQHWACDAVRDIVDGISDLSTSPASAQRAAAPSPPQEE